MYQLIAINHPSGYYDDRGPSSKTPVAQFTSREKAEEYVKSAKVSAPLVDNYSRKRGFHTNSKQRYRKDSVLGSADDYDIDCIGELPVDPAPLPAPADSDVIDHFTWELEEGYPDDGKSGIVVAVTKSGDRVKSSGISLNREDSVRTLNSWYGLKPG